MGRKSAADDIKNRVVELTDSDGGKGKSKGKKTKNAASSTTADSSVGGFGILDLLRILGGLAIVSAGLSYMITGESLTWNYRPWWSRLDQLKNAASGPVSLTTTQLAAYSGTNPSLPIYLALDGIIYDVSAGRPHYGPGGNYHALAGRDATRAFITGCFKEDLTGDIRGAEEMYIPISPAEAEADGRTVEKKYWEALEGAPAMSKAHQKIRREREAREGRKQVAATVENWAVMFRGDKGKDYFKVGTVEREAGWLKGPAPVLCRDARLRRPIRLGP